MVFGGHLTLPKHEIVDSGAFYEVTFFCISPKNLLGDFFYSLNVRLTWSRPFRRSGVADGYALLPFIHALQKNEPSDSTFSQMGDE